MHTSPVISVAGERLEMLAFRLADRRFALRVSDVREIVRAVAIAPLPKAPAIVEGVVNYRGTIVPVLDVRARFGLAAEPLHPNQHFILAHAGPRLVALRVDQADALVEVERHLVEPAAVAPGAEYVAGIARLPDGFPPAGSSSPSSRR